MEPPSYFDVISAPPPPYMAKFPLPSPFDTMTIESDSKEHTIVRVGNKAHRVLVHHAPAHTESWVGFYFLFRCPQNNWGSVVFAASGRIKDHVAYNDTRENRIRRAFVSPSIQNLFLTKPNFHDAGYQGQNNENPPLRSSHNNEILDPNPCSVQ